MERSWTVVGISGATNSGKTTLASFLQKSFPESIVLNQDDFFRPDDSEEHILIKELNHKNWDCLNAINWDKMMERVDKILNSKSPFNKSLFIIEGHLILNYEPLEKLFIKKYFLTLNKEECFKRRCTRVYDPPDIPGYFEKCVWPMYLKNLDEIKMKCTNVLYLDGTDKVKNICERVLDDLNETVFCEKRNEQ